MDSITKEFVPELKCFLLINLGRSNLEKLLKCFVSITEYFPEHVDRFGIIEKCVSALRQIRDEERWREGAAARRVVNAAKRKLSRVLSEIKAGFEENKILNSEILQETLLIWEKQTFHGFVQMFDRTAIESFQVGESIESGASLKLKPGRPTTSHRDGYIFELICLLRNTGMTLEKSFEETKRLLGAIGFNLDLESLRRIWKLGKPKRHLKRIR